MNQLRPMPAEPALGATSQPRMVAAQRRGRHRITRQAVCCIHVVCRDALGVPHQFEKHGLSPVRPLHFGTATTVAFAPSPGIMAACNYSCRHDRLGQLRDVFNPTRRAGGSRSGRSLNIKTVCSPSCYRDR